MKKILLIIAGATAVLLAAAVLLLPRLIDWNNYKATITERLGRSIGRGVDIAGDLSLSLLPRPTLTAEQVRIGPAAGGVPIDLSSLDALRLRLAFLPLLRGRGHVEELVLEAPVVRVSLPDGPAVREQAPQRTDQSPADAATRDDEPGTADFVLRRLVVTDGRVIIQRDNTVIAELADVDGELASSGGTGPLRADGAFDWRGTRIGVKAATGDLAAASIPVSLALHMAEGSSEAKISGQIARNGDQRRFDGKAAVAGANFAMLMKRLAESGVPAAAAADFAFSAEIRADAGEVVAENVDLRIGESQARGAATVALDEPRRAQVTLAMASLDLDRWLAPSPDEARVGQPPATPQPPSPAEERTAAAEPWLRLPGMTIDAEVTADAVVYRGAVLRKAQVDTALRDRVLTMHHASVQIPGPSQFTAAGVVRDADGQLAYDGTFDLGSDNLRAILAWLDVDVTAVPADRLRLFAASGRAAGGGRDIHLSDLDVSLDSSRLAGAVTFRPGPRPGLGANIRIDEIDIDSYLPPTDAAARPPASTPAPATASPTTAPAGAPAKPAWVDLLTRFDANVKAEIGKMTLNAVTLHGLVLDGTLFGDDLTLRRLAVGDGEGVTAEAAGTVAGIGGDELSVRSLTYRLRADQADEAARVFGWQAPSPIATRLGALALTGKIDGDAEALAVEARIETAGGVASTQGRIAKPLGDAVFDLTTEASHADFAEVVRLFAPEYRPAGRMGGFALTSRISGQRTDLQLSDLRARLGAVNVAGSAHLDLRAKPRLDATLEASAITVDAFLPAKRSAGLQTPQRLWLGDEPSAVPVAHVSGAAPGRQPGLTMAAADQKWSREPMDLGWLNTMDANVRLSSPAVTWDKFRVDNATLAMALQDGRLAIERFGGPMLGGQLALDGHLSASGDAAVNVQLDRISLREPILRTAGFRMTSGLLSGSLRLQTEGRSRFEMVSRLRGEGALDSRDGAIHGIDLGAVSQRLSKLEKLEDVLALLQLTMGEDRGATPYSSLTGTVQVANGIVTSNDLALQAEGGTAQGVATVNLPAYTIDGRVVFRLTEPAKAPPFVMLVKGQLDKPRRSFDSRELQDWLLAQGVGRVLEQDKIGRALDKAEEKGVPREFLEGLIQRFGR